MRTFTAIVRYVGTDQAWPEKYTRDVEDIALFLNRVMADFNKIKRDNEPAREWVWYDETTPSPQPLPPEVTC